MFITNVDGCRELPDLPYRKWHKIRVHGDIAMFDPHSRADRMLYDKALSVFRQKRVRFISKLSSDIETKCPRCGFHMSGRCANKFGWGDALEVCPICGALNPRYKEFEDLSRINMCESPVYSYTPITTSWTNYPPSQTIRYVSSTGIDSTIRYESSVTYRNQQPHN